MIDEYGRVVNKDTRYLPGQPNQLDQLDWWYDPQKVVTRMFNFVSILPIENMMIVLVRNSDS